jgi:3-hydroxybutyryl-CoA dehydrogenase
MIKTICVCGAGTMGSGIAQVAAVSGFNVIQFDVDEGMLEKSRTNIDRALRSDVEKKRISHEDSVAAFGRIAFTDEINDCSADIVVEAIVEKLEAKVDLFNQLAAFNSSQTIFASNTSSLSITEIATKIKAPSRVIGMHFFNPAPVMKLVEIIKGDKTSSEVVSTVVALARRMGKTPVVCKDSPGFIVNRVARHFYLEALRLLEAGVADYETIDKALEASGFKLGPFRLMDLIGMDVNYSVSKSVWEAMGKPERLEPSPLQKTKVDAGELGRKTGKGFYEYNK